MDDCAVPAHDSRSARAKDTLALCGGCSGCNQARSRSSTERHNLLRSGSRARRTARNQGGDLLFKLCDQPAMPRSSRRSSSPGDQPVCRSTASYCRRACAASSAPAAATAPAGAQAAVIVLDCADRFECGFDAERLQHAQDLVTDRCVDAQAADRNAARGTVVRTRTVASCSGRSLPLQCTWSLRPQWPHRSIPGRSSSPLRAAPRASAAAHAGRIVGDHLEVVSESSSQVSVGRVVILVRLAFRHGFWSHAGYGPPLARPPTLNGCRAPERVAPE